MEGEKMITKKIRKVVCAVLAGVMVLGSSMTAFAAEQTEGATYTKASEMARVTFKGYNNGTIASPTTVLGLLEYTLDTFVMGDEYNGPIGVVKAQLSKNGRVEDVYVVTLSGTEIIWSNNTGLQSTGVVTDLLCGFNFSNPYIKAVKNVVMNNIPKGSKVMFYGHSLGGMIAQQAAADSTLKRNYNIINTVTYGSPLIKLLSGREGTVKRMCDDADIVPILSVYTLTPLAIFQFWGSDRVDADGGYGSDFLAAHNESYLRDDVWGGYDVTGIKNGHAALKFNINNVQYYDAPAFSWLKLR